MTEPQPITVTDYFPPETVPSVNTTETVVLKQIGRYIIEKVLGKGGFGTVYLARDGQLDRYVAVKVPHHKIVARTEDSGAYINEARTVAQLDHPHIVPVYDVGSTSDFPCYIVSKYISGVDLSTKIKQGPISYAKAIEIVATVAEALHFAHTQGIVHRDVKPGNILIGTDDKPYVVDFGLALREEDLGKQPQFAGTIDYMSPEQARGEGHRVDGRSDIYSLGVVLYKLLAGRLPFPVNADVDLLVQIAFHEPRPLRQIDDRIPKELERICLKCLSKRSSERYTTARDMAQDLMKSLSQFSDVVEASTPMATGAQLESASAPVPVNHHTGDSDHRLIRIVPKGLRPFDEHDADFFLELLPGARDRDGLPECLRFWKTRIEETDSDETFSVGLIYGPSGCGKSSLVKAGLLPRLSSEVLSVYVEATPVETESRLLRGLHKKFPAIDRNLTLKEFLASLRRGVGIPYGKKVLIIIDQFEQWLQQTNDAEDTELVQALRQCDGARVQCLVLVRDDFWMAATRFMKELEVRIIEGQNSASVDLFPIRHAEKVLAAFGRAYGALGDNRESFGADQKAFLKQAVSDLAEEGKVISVRLAMFAEMMKDKVWTQASLREIGGTKGVGVKFLEGALSAPTAPPECRYHQKAARAVLKILLPQSGTHIKGEMKSLAELQDKSGYASRPQDFADLIRILDREIRLITPTSLEGIELTAKSTSNTESIVKYYQLTHDYLVYPLREWLTSKQKETRRGRMELQLDERAAEWNAKPVTRRLPSMWEYVNIIGLTSHATWTATQRRMLNSAGRFYGTRCVIACIVMLLLVAGVSRLQHDYQQAQEVLQLNGLIDQLLVADIGEVPRIAALLEQDSRHAMPRLRNIADDPTASSADRLRATMALSNGPGDDATRLIDAAKSADVQTLATIRNRLTPFAAELADELWTLTRNPATALPSKLRLAALLAVADPGGTHWQESAPTIAGALLLEDTLNLDAWSELLHPAASHLIPALNVRLTNTSIMTTEHSNAARVLARYADGELLSELILNADPPLFSTLFSGVGRHREVVVQKLRGKAADLSKTDNQAKADQLPRLRNAMVALIRLGYISEVQALLSATSQPGIRTMFVLQFRDFGLPAESLLEAYEGLSDPVARQAILLALDRYRDREFSQLTEQQLNKLLDRLLQQGQDLSERSAAEWILRRRGREERIREANSNLAMFKCPDAAALGGRDWWVNSQNQVMAIIRGPVEFTMGSPDNEPGHEEVEKQFQSKIDHSFGLGAHEVTMEQYQRFKPNAEFAIDIANSPRCPANKVSLVDAMQYCRWLSEQEGIADNQMCYPPQASIDVQSLALSDEQLSKTGYRLPTEAEWEYACRARSESPWFFGDNEQDLPRFAWVALNSKSLKPVGELLPNQWGLFDTMGNVAEWCHSRRTPQSIALRGGSYQLAAGKVRSARFTTQSPTGYSFIGFRIARTVTIERLTRRHLSTSD
jgi:serine/threonine protein kinase/formylglycine-generating enzyme required for sulfatase activity